MNSGRVDPLWIWTSGRVDQYSKYQVLRVTRLCFWLAETEVTELIKTEEVLGTVVFHNYSMTLINFSLAKKYSQ